MDGTNFRKTNLSGLDFTVTSKKSYHGTIFKEANLSNSNFEGVDLSPAQIFDVEFENARAKIEGGAFDDLSLLLAVFGSGFIEGVGFIGFDNIDVISTEVRGNDLALKFAFFNNFAHANLENANFKNTGLMFVHFNSANLTNADLSGADLSGVDLSGADLSGADLSGANLSDVIYDQYTILKCVEHPICV